MAVLLVKACTLVRVAVWSFCPRGLRLQTKFGASRSFVYGFSSSSLVLLSPCSVVVTSSFVRRIDQLVLPCVVVGLEFLKSGRVVLALEAAGKLFLVEPDHKEQNIGEANITGF
ncbi:Uncharacterized protein Rs2_16077 [Raphanus sativus]|nr:Uncharacterized protein Rs2_16077 [Raphanus sativus]